MMIIYIGVVLSAIALMVLHLYMSTRRTLIAQLTQSELDRRKNEQKITNLEIRLAALNVSGQSGSVFPEWVVVESKIVYINAAMILFLAKAGKTVEDVINHRLDEIWSADAAKALKELDEKAVHSGQTVRKNIRLLPCLPMTTVGKKISMTVFEGKLVAAMSGVLIELSDDMAD